MKYFIYITFKENIYIYIVGGFLRNNFYMQKVINFDVMLAKPLNIINSLVKFTRWSEKTWHASHPYFFFDMEYLSSIVTKVESKDVLMLSELLCIFSSVIGGPPPDFIRSNHLNLPHSYFLANPPNSPCQSYIESSSDVTSSLCCSITPYIWGVLLQNPRKSEHLTSHNAQLEYLK